MEDIRTIVKKMKPNISEKEIEHFETFVIMVLKFFMLDDVIEKEKDKFPCIVHDVISYLDRNECGKAHDMMGEYLMELQRRREW